MSLQVKDQLRAADLPIANSRHGHVNQGNIAAFNGREVNCLLMYLALSLLS